MGESAHDRTAIKGGISRRYASYWSVLRDFGSPDRVARNASVVRTESARGKFQYGNMIQASSKFLWVHVSGNRDAVLSGNYIRNEKEPCAELSSSLQLY